MAQLRVLVVDDSAAFRSLLIDCINGKPGARVVAFASNGREALEKAGQFEPDLVTLDVEMPVMNGLEALRELRARYPKTAVVMISAHTREAAAKTIEALELGAQGFMEKPEGPDPAQNRASISTQLDDLLAEAIARSAPSPVLTSSTASTKSTSSTPPSSAPQIVAVGSSTGGPRALAEIVSALPGDLGVPVVIVQHMPPLFTRSLAESLDQRSALRVVEAEDGMELCAGTVYVAPGGFQMRVVRGAGRPGRSLALTDDPPENFCKPAADYLFRSVAAGYRAEALGVILTGMGKDGALGLKLMKRYGARVLGQDEATCTVYGMSREAKAAGAVDLELPLGRIAGEIAASVRRRS